MELERQGISETVGGSALSEAKHLFLGLNPCWGCRTDHEMKIPITWWLQLQGASNHHLSCKGRLLTIIYSADCHHQTVALSLWKNHKETLLYESSGTRGLKPSSIIAGASAVLQSRRLSTATTKTGAPSLWKNHKETLQGTRCPKPLSIMQGAVRAPYLWLESLLCHMNHKETLGKPSYTKSDVFLHIV